MSRNGSGVYSLPAGSTVTNGTSSDASDVNTPLADLENDANVARPVVAGGTGATTASGARTNLGLAIGTDVQAYSADLATLDGNAELLDIAGTTFSAGDTLYHDGTDLVNLGKGAAGEALTMNSGATAPEWTQTVPAGQLMNFAGTSAPTGYLAADGTAVSRTTYAALFAVIGTMYGVGDGSTTFNLPDFRGYFARGFDNSAGNDPDAASRTDRGDGTTGDAVGTKQDHAFQGHDHHSGAQVHKSTGTSVVYGSGGNSGGKSQSDAGTTEASGYGTPNISSETRPKNISVLICIKT